MTSYSYLFIIFSIGILFFIAGIFLFKKAATSKINKIIYIILALVTYLGYISYAIADYFTREGINAAVIFHLKYGLKGAGIMEYWNLISLALISIFFGTILAYWASINNKKNTKKNNYHLSIAYLFMAISICINPASKDLLNLYNYSNSKNDSKQFAEYYKKPRITQNNKNKNLVFIYAEGLERTYFDEKVFPGLINGLKELQSSSTYFTNINQVEGPTFCSQA